MKSQSNFDSPHQLIQAAEKDGVERDYGRAFIFRRDVLREHCIGIV